MPTTTFKPKTIIGNYRGFNVCVQRDCFGERTVWVEYLLYGTPARLVSAEATFYTVREAKEEIDTYIDGVEPAWTWLDARREWGTRYYS